MTGTPAADEMGLETKSREEIVRWLEQAGYRFSELKLVSEGNYAPEDSDWNYKDLVHLRFVHGQLAQLQTAISPKINGALQLQRMFGMWVPLIGLSYDAAKFHLVTVFTLFFFAVVVETRPEPISAGRTRVSTSYFIGAPLLFSPFIPVVKWALARNYRRLMKDDTPMRERRGLLRSLGYKFRRDGETYGFTEMFDVMRNRLVVPERSIKLVHDYSALRKDGDEACFGDVGLLGFRLVRQQERIQVFPRACPHQGASLDQVACRSGTLSCPWHGRRIPPLAAFRFNEDVDFAVERYRFRTSGLQLTVEYTSTGS